MKQFILSLFLSIILAVILNPLTVSVSYAQTCTDVDGDGYGLFDDASCPNAGVDCDDTDSNVYPGAPRICDAKDSDCDGFDDFFTDKDQDGDGSTLCSHWQTGLRDCDDNNPVMYPGNVEGPFGDPTCSDGFDNDCDYRKDGSDNGCSVTCQDSDGDGYGNPGNVTCPNGNALDCNDSNDLINPGATDTNCNGVDDNCSGTEDDGYVPTATNCGVGECASTGTLSCSGGVEADSCSPGLPVKEGAQGHPTCSDTLDNDCDGATDGSDIGCQGTCLDDDGDGYGFYGDPSCTNPGADCDDDNAAVNPGATDDVCDGVDANCSGTADDQYIPPVTNCGVGECETTGLLVCAAGATVDNCSPLAPGTEGPFGDPTCSDTLDNDCDGVVDAPDNDCNPLDQDNDGDGFCETGPCQNPVNLDGDCDDTDPVTYPGAPRICDAKDNDCDGFQDFFTDKDTDGDGATLCVHYQTGLQDCNDSDPNRFPGNIEIFGHPSCVDGIDNDCNYKIDDKDIKCLDQCNDGDGDGYGNPGHTSCSNGGATDCDNANSLVNPGAVDDTCDGVDNNCSGTEDDGYVPTSTNCGVGECANTGTLTCSVGVVVDNCTPLAPAKEGAQGNPTCSDTLDNDCDGMTDASDIGCQSSCLDDDGDGYGHYGDASCPNAGVDCDDDNAAINPGAVDDVCDGVDANCSGTADDQYVQTGTSCGLGECAATGQLVCVAGAVEDNCSPLAAGVEDYLTAGVCIDTLDNDCDGDIDLGDIGCNPPDVDNDGDGFCEAGPCQNPANLGGDCDDLDATVRPGGDTTVCDGKDTNCDTFLDFFTDRDTDGDGVPLCGGDCNDSDPTRYPGNQEGPFGDATCSDGIDNDCNNKTDNADSQCAEPTCTTQTNPKNGPHMFDLLDGGNNVLKTPCQWCHFDDTGTVDERRKCERCHADPALGGPDDGTLKVLYPLDPPYGFGTALNVQMHSSTVLGTKYGNWDMDCLTCHNPHTQEQDVRYGTSYGKLVREKICFDNSVSGLNTEEIIEFTAPDGAGSFADGPPHNENICEMCHTQTNHHQNDGTAPGGQSHYDGEKCTGCHTHDSGFKPGAAGQGHDTHLNSIQGPQISCDTDNLGCHGANTPPILADGNVLETSSVCDICHSPGGSFDGVDDPVTGAKVNWPDGVYEGRTLAFGKEFWCAGCHDDAPSNSKIDGTGVSAGNVTGDNATVGFYITGHGNDPGVNCIQCHDASKKHIDHLFTPVEDVIRVWENPTNYRFYDGKGMSLPHARKPAPVADDFRLCFTCHDETWFDTANMTTNFRIENPPFSSFLNSYNLHYFHIFSTGNLSGTNCILCHDPHGTDRPVMIDVAFSGVFSYLTLDSGLGRYVALTNPADWHNPALNAGGVITQNGPCFNCHSDVPDEQTLAAGLGPAENVDDGWYLRQYNAHAFTVNFDVDGDGISDAEDNCAGVINDQTDSDGDGIGDDCDNCVNEANALQTDTDNDGAGNVCDPSCDTSVLEWRFQFGSDTPVGGSTQDRARALTLDSNGNIFVAGHATGNFIGSSTPNYSYGADVFLRKYDSNGNALWTEKAASPLWDDVAKDVALDSNGNIYVTGYTLGSFPNNTNLDEGVTNDLFVVKFAPNKTISWIKQLGTAQNDQAYAMAIDSNDNIYVFGTTSGDLCGTLDGASDYFLIKFDTSGNSVCVDQFGTSEADNARDVEVDSAGNLYVAFGTYGSLPGFTNIGDYDSFVIKYDQAGTRQQTLQIGTIGSDQANGIDIGTDNSIYVAGTTSGSLTGQQSSGSNEIFLIKYDTGGASQWIRQWGVIVSSVQKIAVDHAGNSFILGYTTAPLDGMDHFGSTDIFLVKYDTLGNRKWAKSWGGLWSDEAPDIALDNEGNHYIAGYTEYEFPPNTNTGTFGYDAILLKGSEVCP